MFKKLIFATALLTATPALAAGPVYDGSIFGGASSTTGKNGEIDSSISGISFNYTDSIKGTYDVAISVVTSVNSMVKNVHMGVKVHPKLGVYKKNILMRYVFVTGSSRMASAVLYRNDKSTPDYIAIYPDKATIVYRESHDGGNTWSNIDIKYQSKAG